jgi:hypothetical protein
LKRLPTYNRRKGSPSLSGKTRVMRILEVFVEYCSLTKVVDGSSSDTAPRFLTPGGGKAISTSLIERLLEPGFGLNRQGETQSIVLV